MTWIDVHHHFLPPVYVQALRHAHRDGGAPIPSWDAATSVAQLDRHGIDAAVLSISSPGVHFGDDRQAGDLARACNEVAADLIRHFPTRFGAFAVLPLPDVEGALVEVGYALDTLHLDGVGLFASPGGIYLGDPRYEPLFAELHRRQAVVLLHPVIPPTPPIPSLRFPPPLLEYVFDTTRAIANLIFSGTMERYPAITWITVHAGGTAPYLAYRLGHSAFLLPDKGVQAPQGAEAYLKRLYYDTAVAIAPTTLTAVQSFAGPEHLLFGSDAPYAAPPMVAEALMAVHSWSSNDPPLQTAISSGNALRLFPRLARP